MNATTVISPMAERAQSAARALRNATADRKNAALIGAAEAVSKRRAKIMEANALDMQVAHKKGLSPAALDRLELNEARIEQIINALRAVAEQPDPVGEVLAEWNMATGLRIRRQRTPIGVIGVIFESRPNVTTDAGALCLKAGNAVILRGGSDSVHSTEILHDCLTEGLSSAALPVDLIQRVPTQDRNLVDAMLKAVNQIDVIVPRGGKALVALVQEKARVPVFAHLEGICHIYIDKSADPAKTHQVVINAKTRRTGICGAVECLLIHRDALELGQSVIDALMEAGVEVRATAGLRGTKPAMPEDFGQEFLDMAIAAKLVDTTEEAVAHILNYGSNHTDCIMTEDDRAADQFISALDSSILMRNTSTQFADGHEFGLGAEIGISTGKIHARGPIGAAQLTTFRYIVESDGAARD